MAWAWKNLTTAINDLASRLDAQKVFWNASELPLWVIESLRTWNAAAQFHRARSIFNTIPNQTFYDLTSVTDCGNGVSNPPALLGYTLTDRDLINQIEYNLLEPITTVWASGWTGTEQFALDEITQAVSRRRNQFLLETGLTQSHSTLVPTSDHVVLPDTVIDVRRVAWKDAVTNIYTPLWRADEWQANALSVGWENRAATPKAYSVILSPHVGLQLIPPPDAVGSLDLITINTGAAFDPVNTATLLGIPDDFAWVIRFGALADLLSKDGQASDPTRLKYCEQRWNEGLKLAEITATIQLGQINGVNKFPHSLHDLDSLRRNWQSQAATPTAPSNIIGVEGRNLIVLTPTPDATPTSVTLDVLRNAPVPILGTDFLQIGREQYDVIVGYAAHLAAFKMQGDEFLSTMPQMDNLYRLAAENSDRLKAEAGYFESLQSASKREGQQRPRREEAA